MIHLDYRDARPIYLQICDGIRQQIRGGVLQSGDRLPSVRELATALTINPNTIQRAYRELEAQKWVTSVAGKGCFVSGVPEGPDPRQQQLLQEFDALVQQLQKAGISPEMLKERLK